MIFQLYEIRAARVFIDMISLEEFWGLQKLEAFGSRRSGK
jgi:hypothetical protein